MRYSKRKLTKLALTKRTRQQYAAVASYELMERGLLYRGTIPGSGFLTTLPTAIDLTKKGAIVRPFCLLLMPQTDIRPQLVP